MLDGLRIAFYVGIAAAIVLVVSLIIVGAANGGSRNISLSLGTLFGALLLLGIQLAFELRPMETVAIFQTDFTTDNEKPKIEQFRYPISSAHRAINEVEANKFLLAKNPLAFQGDGEKLWKDMSIFSLVLYLWTEQHDWQIARDSLGDHQGGYEQFRYLSKSELPNQCSKVAFSRIQVMLDQVDNVFAYFKPVTFPFDFMCLPPDSSIHIEAESLTIETRLCRIHFAVETPWIMKDSRKPGTNDSPLVEGKRARFETRSGIIRATVTYDWMRAQSREMPKYQTWANDVVERARKWFNAEIPEGNNFIKSDFD